MSVDIKSQKLKLSSNFRRILKFWELFWSQLLLWSSNVNLNFKRQLKIQKMTTVNIWQTSNSMVVVALAIIRPQTSSNLHNLKSRSAVSHLAVMKTLPTNNQSLPKSFFNMTGVHYFSHSRATSKNNYFPLFIFQRVSQLCFLLLPCFLIISPFVLQNSFVFNWVIYFSMLYSVHDSFHDFMAGECCNVASTQLSFTQTPGRRSNCM